MIGKYGYQAMNKRTFIPQVLDMRSQSVSHPPDGPRRFKVEFSLTFVLKDLQVDAGWLSEGELLLPHVPLISGQIL